MLLSFVVCGWLVMRNTIIMIVDELMMMRPPSSCVHQPLDLMSELWVVMMMLIWLSERLCVLAGAWLLLFLMMSSDDDDE
jgi:hypothetical protein